MAGASNDFDRKNKKKGVIMTPCSCPHGRGEVAACHPFMVIVVVCGWDSIEQPWPVFGTIFRGG